MLLFVCFKSQPDTVSGKLFNRFLIFLILLQRASTSAGLGTAFGGGFAESTFGADAGGMLKKWTYFAAVAFFLVSFGLYLGYISEAGGPQVEEGRLPASISDTTPAPAPATSLPAENSGYEFSVPALSQSPALEDASGEVLEEDNAESGESETDGPNQN